MPGTDAIAAWLLAVSWQLLPLTAIVFILDLALRRAGPVVRSALWWMVLAKLVIPPGIASPLSIAQLLPVDDVVGIVAATTAGPASLALATAPAAAPGARDHWDVLLRSWLALPLKSNRASGAATSQALPAAVPANAAGTSSSPTMMNAAAPEARIGRSFLGPPWKFNRASGAAVLALWGAGMAAVAFFACWRYRRLRAACLDDAQLLTPKAPDGREVLAGESADIGAAAESAARRLGLSTLPPIFVAAGHAPAVGLPAVVGFFAPCIVLPRALLDRSRAEVEHVLLHELAHVRRGDPLASLVCLVAQIVFWFHPAVWCARRRLATLREMACDRTVARVLGDDTRAYRRTLILLASAAPSSSHRFAAGPGALGLFERRSQIVTRLDALARPVSMRRATECAVSAAIASAILVSCVPLAPATTTPEVSIDVPPLDQLPGSLQKRYAVMRALALAEQAQPPRPSR